MVGSESLFLTRGFRSRESVVMLLYQDARIDEDMEKHCISRQLRITHLLVPSVSLLIVVFASLGLQGCALKSLFEGRKGAGAPPTVEVYSSKVTPPPLIAKRAATDDLRALRRVVIAPIFVLPSADSARSYGGRFDNSLGEIVEGTLQVETIAGKAVQQRAEKIFGRNRTTHEKRIELMSALGGNALLETVITQFQDRQGSKIGSDSPAQVGIHYFLYANAREPIWEATFHFTDVALTDNLLSVDNRFSGIDGAGWKGAPSLVEESMRQALIELELQRAGSFAIQ